MADHEFFAKLEFFGALEPSTLETLAKAARHQHLQRGDVVFEEGQAATELYVVVSGRIAIANRSPDGRESLFALMGAGDLFGEMALFDGLGRSAGARALEPSEIVSLPFALLREKLTAEPQALWSVVGLMARRLRTTDEALADSVFLDVTGRTAKRLLEIAGDGDEFQLPVTQEELAGMVGASRERVNKAIAAFIRLGWIEQFERTYRIIDRRKLSMRSS